MYILYTVYIVSNCLTLPIWRTKPIKRRKTRELKHNILISVNIDCLCQSATFERADSKFIFS